MTVRTRLSPFIFLSPARPGAVPEWIKAMIGRLVYRRDKAHYGQDAVHRVAGKIRLELLIRG